MSKQIIGKLSKEIINMFSLKYSSEQDIYLYKQRKKHISKKHKSEFKDFEKAYSMINTIISNPDYVGLHPDGKSLQFIKFIDEYALVAIRINSGDLTVRTMYTINKSKLNNYILSGRLKKYKTC